MQQIPNQKQKSQTVAIPRHWCILNVHNVYKNTSMWSSCDSVASAVSSIKHQASSQNINTIMYQNTF